MEAFARQYERDREISRHSERQRSVREYLTIAGLFLSAVIAVFQWRELRSTDHHIDEQAKISARQLTLLENDKRPWISAEVSISNVSVSEWAGSRGIDVPLKFTLKNHGQAPAVNVRTYQTIFIHPGNPRREELSAPQKIVCEGAGAESDKNPIGGIAIFPSETAHVETAVGISGGPIYHDKKPTLFAVLGCVDYTYGDSKHGQTGFRFVLGQGVNGLVEGVPYVEGAPLENYVSEDMIKTGFPATPPKRALIPNLYFKPADSGNYAR